MSTTNFVKASPNEEILAIMTENKEKRKQRLLQVRQQDKLHSMKLHQKIKETKDKELKGTILQLKDEIIKQRKESEMQLMKEFKKRLNSVGAAHNLQGKGNLGARKRLSAIAKLNITKRYQNAMKQVQEHQHQKVELQKNQQLLREKVQSMEKEREKEVLLKPRANDPIANLKPVKYIASSFSKQGMETFFSTRYHLGTTNLFPEVLVEKVSDDEQVDAKRAAIEENEKLRISKEKQECEINERREKAEIRQGYAHKEVILNQKKDALLQDLEKLHFEDRNRRRQLVSDIPKKIFQPPYQREKDAKSKQYAIEQAFERLYHVKCDDPMKMYYQVETDHSKTKCRGKAQERHKKEASNVEISVVQLLETGNERIESHILPKDQPRSPMELDRDFEKKQIGQHPKNKLERLRKKIKTQKDKYVSHPVEGFTDIDSASAGLLNGNVEGLRSMNIESACDSHSMKSYDQQKDEETNEPTFPQSEDDKVHNENPLTRQNIAFNERLLQHQKCVLELQKRHLQNKSIKQKLVDYANQQEVHIYLPQSFQITTPSTVVTSNGSRTDPVSPSKLQTRPKQKMYASSTDELNLSLSSHSESDHSPTLSSQGSDLSPSISFIPSQSDGCNKKCNKKQNIEPGVQVIGTCGGTAMQANTIEYKSVGETQTMDIDEYEVETQTSSVYDESKTSINGYESPESINFKKWSNKVSMDSKRDVFRQKYPNIFDASQSRKAFSVLDRMCSGNEMDDNQRPDSSGTQQQALKSSGDSFHPERNLIVSTGTEKNFNIQQDVTTLMYNPVLNHLSDKRILYEHACSDVRETILKKVNMQMKEALAVQTNDVLQQMSGIQQEESNGMSQTNNMSYQPENDIDFRSSKSTKGDNNVNLTPDNKTINQQSIKSLPTVDSILQELQNLQHLTFSQEKQQESTKSLSSNSNIRSSVAAVSIYNIGSATPGSIICSKVDVPILTSVNRKTFNPGNLPSSALSRALRVSEHPHVSPIKEIEEISLMKKQNSVGSLQEQSLSDLSFHTQAESYEYNEDGLSLVRASTLSVKDGNNYETFLPLHKQKHRENSQQFATSFKFSLNSTSFGSHHETFPREEKFRLLEEDATAVDYSTLSIPEKELNDQHHRNISDFPISVTDDMVYRISPIPEVFMSSPSTSHSPSLFTSNVFQKLRDISNTPTDNINNDDQKSKNDNFLLDRTNRNNSNLFQEPFGVSTSTVTDTTMSVSKKYQALLERVKQLPLVHAEEQQQLLESYHKLTESAHSRDELKEHSIQTFFDFPSDDNSERETESQEKEDQIDPMIALTEQNVDFNVNSMHGAECFDTQNEFRHTSLHDVYDTETRQQKFIPLPSSHDDTCVDAVNNDDVDDFDISISEPAPIVFSFHKQQKPSEVISASIQCKKQTDINFQESVESFCATSISDVQDAKEKFVMSYFHDTTPDLTSFPKQSESVSDVNSMFSLTQESFLPLPGSMRIDKERTDAIAVAEDPTEPGMNVDKDFVVIIEGERIDNSNKTCPKTSFDNTTEQNPSTKSFHISDVNHDRSLPGPSHQQTNTEYTAISSDRTMTELMNLSSLPGSGSHFSFSENSTMGLISQLISSKSKYSDTESSELFTVGRLELKDSHRTTSKQSKLLSDDQTSQKDNDQENTRKHSSTILRRGSNLRLKTDLLSDINLSEMSESCVNWSSLVPTSEESNESFQSTSRVSKDDFISQPPPTSGSIDELKNNPIDGSSDDTTLDVVKCKEKSSEDRAKTKRLYERLPKFNIKSSESERDVMRRKNRVRAQKFNQKLRMKMKKTSDNL